MDSCWDVMDSNIRLLLCDFDLEKGGRLPLFILLNLFTRWS